jgi:myosin heavy subunit
MQVTQLMNTVQEQRTRIESNEAELSQVKIDLESTIKQRNELAETKLNIDAQNRDMTRRIEILEHDNASYKKDQETFVSENKELRELKLDNGKDITEYRLKNEHLTKEISDKGKACLDKDTIIQTQSSQIKQYDDRVNKQEKQINKMDRKLDECVKQINSGNEYIEKQNKDRKKYKSMATELKEKYRDYEDLQEKAKLCDKQKETIDYLQKRLTEEQQLNTKSGLLANNNSRFQPSFNPSGIPPTGSLSGSSMDVSNRGSNIPKSTNFQPQSYKSSFNSSERPPNGTGASRYSFQNTQMTPGHQSPYSRYSENQTLKSPSASSVHSINISGLSAPNSVHSGYQVHSASNNTASFKKEIDIRDTITNTQENRPPNASVMSLVHTTKPGTASKTGSFIKTTSDANMFDRKLSEEDE